MKFNILLKICIICLISILLVSCAKEIKTETTIEEATVVGCEESGGNMTFIFNGKTTIPVRTSKHYYTTISYNNGNYLETIDDEEVYKYCKYRSNNKIKCKIITKYYDDNTSESFIDTIIYEDK